MTTTETAKALIAAVARAFYDDQTIVVVDFLLRNSFLKKERRMGKRIRLSTKQLSATLQFLSDEHLVYTEEVVGIVAKESGGRVYRRKQAADFFYIDLNLAVHAIRLRLHSLHEHLLQTENAAMTATTYKCPNCEEYADNALYTELEVQSCPVNEEGEFLCLECSASYPCGAPNSIVLVPVDTGDDLRLAKTLLSRLKVQMTSKTVVEGIGERQLRPGIYELLHQISESTKKQGQAVTSNLPSENGAEEFLSSGEYKDDEPVREGLVYFRNPTDGENLALEIIDVRSAGNLAHKEASLGMTLREERKANATEGIVLESAPVKSCLKSPESAIRRQATPDFLNKCNFASRTVDDMDVLWRTRELSLDSKSSWRSISFGTADDLDKLDSSDHVASVDAGLPPSSNGEDARSFLERFEAELKRHRDTFPRPTHSFANKDISSSTYGSVEWEEG